MCSEKAFPLSLLFINFSRSLYLPNSFCLDMIRTGGFFYSTANRIFYCAVVALAIPRRLLSLRVFMPENHISTIILLYCKYFFLHFPNFMHADSVF